jgi:hypothetical protein
MQPWQGWMVSSLSLAVSYAVASLTPMNGWIEFWLRGSFYTAYQTMLVAALLPYGALLARRHHKRPRSLLAMTAGGAVLGYLAGLIAFLLHPLAQPDGTRLFLDSIPNGEPEALFAFLWFPVKLLSWLYGAMTGLSMGLLLRIIDRSQRQSSTHEA